MTGVLINIMCGLSGFYFLFKRRRGTKCIQFKFYFNCSFLLFIYLFNILIKEAWLQFKDTVERLYIFLAKKK